MDTIIQTIRIYSPNIELEFGIEKRIKTNNERIKIAKSRKNQNAGRKGNLGILEADVIKQMEMK